uniref:OBG-type G domain-containing protein n=1 Tax=Glossina brevipalpis TaxID=37001 RepID=A0A1A9W5C2_9MUSC
MALKYIINQNRRFLCASSSKNSNLHIKYSAVEALLPKKAKSTANERPSHFLDSKVIRTAGGKGGDGSISFLQLWCNENAGPDGGDGGNGGHIIFQATKDVRSLNHLSSNVCGDAGQNGRNKECHGKNAHYTMTKVPVGTIVRNQQGTIIGDLNKENMMFVAARGGAGGKGNRFFTTDRETAPKICEYGQEGEDLTYVLELRSIADIGLIGYPNAGKSTLLNAITRARPKIAPYAFTTLQPYVGMVQYSDHTQIAVADLPGIIPDSHQNRGLGIEFLKHIERCLILIFLVDASADCPWLHYENLLFELEQFNKKLLHYPKIIVANKIDQLEGQDNLRELENKIDGPLVKISAKHGTNLDELLRVMRETYENYNSKTKY